MGNAILPAMQTVGAIKPHTLILEMPISTKSGLEDSINGGYSNEPARIYAHEMHHWFDLVGTIWGQHYLDILFSAYDAVIAARSEDEAYPAVLRLFDADREILFPSYYKFVTPGAPHGRERQWSNEATVGFRIRPDGTRDEDHPILFVRFTAGDQIVARQPLSAGSLLELRALAAEDIALTAHLARLDPDQRLVEKKLRQQELISHLYHPEMTTYSAAAHLLARVARIGATAPVLLFGAVAADICLNLQRPQISGLRHPQPFMELSHRHRHGFRARVDPGYLFACLIYRLRELEPHDLTPARIDDALRLSGLPTLQTIYDDAQRAFSRRPKPTLRSARLARIRASLHSACGPILQARSQGSGLIPQERWKDLPSPLTMSSDLELFHHGQHTISTEDAEWLEEQRWSLDRSIRQALRAARGFDFKYTDYTY
ncbi:hypothetical protein [Sphingomonas sp.]|uniref:hypothetical protein n=1 Tax=Sphingomonas sp. TaxID=28214 RepID=UPI00307CCE67